MGGLYGTSVCRAKFALVRNRITDSGGLEGHPSVVLSLVRCRRGCARAATTDACRASFLRAQATGAPERGCLWGLSAARVASPPLRYQRSLREFPERASLDQKSNVFFFPRMDLRGDTRIDRGGGRCFPKVKIRSLVLK